MSPLYRLQKKDLPKAAEILANAFMDDPLACAFKELPDFKEKFTAFFQVPITYAHKYGEVFAPSKDLEGIMAWTPGHKAEMSLWRIMRSGAIKPAMQMGQAYKNIKPFVVQTTKDRKHFMKGKDFYYLAIIGVSPDHQGKGFGKRLLQAFIEHGKKNDLPLYLETETEQNSSLYQHFGFKTLNQTEMPSLNMNLWSMVRESKKNYPIK